MDNALQRLSGSEHDDDELYVRHAVSDKPGWRVTARARASESGAEEHEHKAYSYSPSAEIYASNPYSASGPKRTGLTNPADGPYPVGSAALFKTKVSNSYNAGVGVFVSVFVVVEPLEVRNTRYHASRGTNSWLQSGSDDPLTRIVCRPSKILPVA